MTRRTVGRSLLATALTLVLGFGLVSAAPPQPAVADVACNENPRPVVEGVQRIAGADRYSTAVAISKLTYAPRQCNIYVASGADFPDALAGSAAAAGAHGGTKEPLLLVQPNRIPASVRAEILRLRPWRIVVLGGRGAISDPVVKELASLAEGGVMRYGDSDRYATAAKIYDSTGPVNTVYIASGQTFPDALSGAPVAGKTRSPLLLVPRYSIPNSVRTRLNALDPKTIVVLGGDGAVSGYVERGLRNYAGTVIRIAGSDRYATAVEVSKHQNPAGATIVFVASGRNYPDALAAGPAAARALGGSLLLVEPGKIPAVVGAELERLQPSQIIILGGTGAVSADVQQQLGAYVVP